MPKMTGARLFAEMMHGYEVSHIFFVPAFMLKAFAEMEDMPIARIRVAIASGVLPRRNRFSPLLVRISGSSTKSGVAREST